MNIIYELHIHVNYGTCFILLTRGVFVNILNVNSLAISSSLSLYFNFAYVNFLTQNFTSKITTFYHVFMHWEIFNKKFLLVLWEFHTCIQYILFIPTVTFPKNFSQPLPHPCYLTSSLLFIITHWVLLKLLIYTRMWNHLLEHSPSAWDHTPKENWFSLTWQSAIINRG